MLQLLRAADELRAETSIILAGYKEEIENKLFAADAGFRSRFISATFEDLTYDELLSVLKSLVSKYDWKVEDTRVLSVAARRVSRGRGVRGFANARAVRSAFEAAYKAALERDENTTTLAVCDFIGKPPTVDSRPQLQAAFDDLNALVGLSTIKQSVHRLAVLARVNYGECGVGVAISATQA